MSKQFIPCQCDLLAIKCFIFHVNLRAQFFMHQEGLVMSSGMTTGESGNRPQEKQHGGGQFLHSQAEEFFASILSIFSQCTACQDERDGDQAELLGTFKI